MAPMHDSQPHLLVIDDDQRLRELLRRYLAGEGFRVTLAADAEEARGKMDSMVFDLLVLDIMLPGSSGLEMTQSLRESDGVPILLLSAKGEPDDRIAGLAAGADDYLAKPFEPRELVLRINAILRRAQRPADKAGGAVIFGAFAFDLAREELTRDGAFVYLTEAETLLLAELARNSGTAVSREVLAQNSTAGNVRSVDVQMTRLRRKIEDDPRFPRYLQTVRGTGYVLLPD
jgi:two-component system phosphate regulon response regulator OmpR